jgi:hypothetical protein
VRVLRLAIAALVTAVFPACGDDPPHYIDASTGNGDEIDASSNLHDAPPVDAPAPPPDGSRPDAQMQDAQPQDAQPQDAQPQDAQPQDAQPQDASPPQDSTAPLDAITGDGGVA